MAQPRDDIQPQGPTQPASLSLLYSGQKKKEKGAHVVVINNDLREQVELAVSGGGHCASVQTKCGGEGAGGRLKSGAGRSAERRAGKGCGKGHAVREKEGRQEGLADVGAADGGIGARFIGCVSTIGEAVTPAAASP